MWQRIKRALNLGSASNKEPNRRYAGIRDEREAVIVSVTCDRCGEIIEVRLRKSSDIQRNYESNEAAYYVRKTIVGNECFNRIELSIEFDQRYRPIDVVVEGGTIAGDDNHQADE